MANVVLKSERQIQTKLLSKLISKLGLNDLNPGSVLDVLTQAIAQQDFALYYQLAQISRLSDIGSLTGSDLDLKAFEYGIVRREALKANGTVTIQRPSGFEKVSTTFYAGFPAPLAGDTVINVNDASNSLIGTSGTLILGRGSNNYEEATYSAAPVNNTNYYTYTLDFPLTNNHSGEETVILKQGSDEVISAGTTLIVPATGSSAEIQFVTKNDVTLPSGEAEITGVEVEAVKEGTSGNIASGSIFGTPAFGSSPPFIGARAINTSKFTTGRARETDDELRDRITSAVQALSKGVKQAILNAIVGLVDPVSAKRVVSASVILPVSETGPVIVYIDDGTGFEPTFTSQGFEVIRLNSTGAEERLQLDKFPVVKAQGESNTQEPYDMSSGPLTLEYFVGTVSETITFNPADFRFPELATAEEISAAINDKSNLLESRTSESGKTVTITAKSDTNENFQITGGTANSIINFPTDEKQTLNLYIDDVQLSKDGATAILDSGNISPYNLLAVGSFPHTLTLVVDGKTANPQTATINSADVSNEAAVTVSEIVAVLNRDLAGVTASGINSNTKVRLASNTKLSVGSKLQVTGGTMNDASNGLNFSTSQVTGLAGDFVFNRELGIIELGTPLSVNQTVTSGSLFTRAKLRAGAAEVYAPNNGETLVISVDGGSDQTITFDGTFTGGATAQATADFINLQLEGATAIAREIGSQYYLEINSNTYDISGTLEIKGTSTANGAFSFTLDTEVSGSSPNKAYQVSSSTGAYDLFEGANLVVVIDNDIVNNTFLVLLNVSKPLTAATSTTVFAASTLPSIFTVQDELIGYHAAFTSGANTTSETVSTVADQGGGVARYTFSAAPANFGDYAVGDLVNFSGLDDSENNVNGVVTGKGSDWVEITNTDVVNASSQTGTGVLSQKRTVTAYNNVSGQVTVGVAYSNTPSISDPLLLIPSTVTNVVDFLNNTKLTSLSLKADIGGASANSKIQISSKSSGSDGYVQVTGGSANDVFNFSTELYRGLAGYKYWSGLLALVHKTIYGDDTDLVSYPGVGAAGILFRVKAPTTKDITVELDVTLSEGISITSLENEIKSAVTGYVNNLGVGEDVILEEIRAAVIAISGIINVSLNDPSSDIAIAENEIARISDADILIG